MNKHAARAALERMNLREMAIWPSYNGFLSDMQMLAAADPVKEALAFIERKTEMCAAFGLADGGVQTKPFAFAAGIAIIPISGTLINRFGYSYSSVTGYNFIRSQVAAAGMDTDVKGIVYDVNSYGGEAAGCFECAADMQVLANGKPTLAVIDSNCYSAAMALASSADRIVSTPSGGAGSVGVVTMHADYSGMLDEMGVKITFIQAGDHKTDGNPYEALSAPVKADIQKSINKSYAAFTSMMAENRDMSVDDVVATQARCYRADDALEVGFIDAIESPGTAVQGFFAELSGSNVSLQQEPLMADNTSTTPEAQAAALAKINSDKAAADARTAEKARTKGIMGSAEAKGREELASHIAFDTDMTVEQAEALMKVSPKTVATVATANPLVDAMNATGGGPRVGADGVAEADNKDQASKDVEASNFLLSCYSAASGRKLKLVGEK